MFIMIIIEFYNAISKFVNSARVLLLLTYMLYWCKFQSNIALFVDDSIYEHIKLVKIVFSRVIWTKKVILFIKTIRLEICLHNTEYLTLYFACNMTLTFSILVNHLNCIRKPFY